MGTSTITLTNTPQQLSAGAVYAQRLNGSYFNYAFGATTPSTAHHHTGVSVYYDGAFGPIWAWVSTETTAQIVVSVV